MAGEGLDMEVGESYTAFGEFLRVKARIKVKDKYQGTTDEGFHEGSKRG